MSDSEKPSNGDDGDSGARSSPARSTEAAPDSVEAACSALITTGNTLTSPPAAPAHSAATLLERRLRGDGEADDELLGEDHMLDEDGLSARSNSDRRWTAHNRKRAVSVTLAVLRLACGAQCVLCCLMSNSVGARLLNAAVRRVRGQFVQHRAALTPAAFLHRTGQW